MGLIFVVVCIGLLVESITAVGLTGHLQYERIDANSREIDRNGSAVEATHRKYSDWTRWSRCSRGCHQKRFRTCVHTIEKECSHGPLHVQTRPCKKCTEAHKSRPLLRQSTIDDLLGSNSAFEDFFFTSWNRWTLCSFKECKQYRWKVCSFYPLCGEKIMVQQRTCREKDFGMCEDREDASEIRTSTTSATVTQILYEHNEENIAVPSEPFTCGLPQLSLQSPNSIATKIFGGKASTAGRWPWQVSLLNQYSENYCAGTLISNWVLTAAHCVRRKMYVRTGEYNILKEEASEQLFRPSKIIVHRHFNTETIENDIALIKLPDSIKWGPSAHPVCLPQLHEDTLLFNDSTTCMILGWGKRRSNSRFGSDVLHEAEIEIIRHTRCKAAYASEHPITTNMICAGSGRNSRSDTCEGDSGGPLLCRLGSDGSPWKIFGITSFGDGCGKREKFGVYTRVTAFLDWINNVVTRE